MRIVSSAISGEVLWSMSTYDNNRRLEFVEKRRGIHVIFDENSFDNPIIHIEDIDISFTKCDEVKAKPYNAVEMITDKLFHKKVLVHADNGLYVVEANFIRPANILETLVRNGIIEMMLTIQFENEEHKRIACKEYSGGDEIGAWQTHNSRYRKMSKVASV